MALYLDYSERNKERIKGRLRGAASWLFIRGFINEIGSWLYAGIMEIPNVEHVMWASQPGACLLNVLKKFSLVLRYCFA